MLQALVFTLASADMTLDRSRFLHGLFFCCITLMFWGMLPIALKRSTGFIDPVTLTWLRFAFAGIVMLIWQDRQSKLSEFRHLSGNHSGRLIVSRHMQVVMYTLNDSGLISCQPAPEHLSFLISPLVYTSVRWLSLSYWVFLARLDVLHRWAGT